MKALSSHRRRVWSGGRGGFTIVELTVVMSIIALLAAILFPVFAKARQKADSAQCLSNLQQIWLGLRMYAADNGGFYPPSDNHLEPLYPRYLPHADVFLCPSVPDEVRGRNVNRDYQYKGGLATDAPPEFALGSDRAIRHMEGADFLFADGHVKWLRAGPDAKIAKLLSASGLPLPRTPEGVPWEAKRDTE